MNEIVLREQTVPATPQRIAFQRRLDQLKERTDMADLQIKVNSLMNLIAVSTGRATHYLDKEDMEAQIMRVHKDVFAMDRGVYAMLHLMGGCTDFAIQKMIFVCLSNNWTAFPESILDQKTETKIIDRATMSIQNTARIFRFMVNDLKGRRINNARTHSYMLRWLLNQKGIDFLSVKYRKKMSEVITHGVGSSMANALRGILNKDDFRTLEQKEKEILKSAIGRHVANGIDRPKLYESISFSLGNDRRKLPIHKKFHDAKDDIAAGKGLPKTTLEGIWATYHHESVNRKDFLNLVASDKRSMTNTERRLTQKSAAKAGTTVSFNPYAQGIVDLFIYGHEMGFDHELKNAIGTKAKKIAESISVPYENIAIVFDDSRSSYGDDTNALKPYCIGQSMIEVLRRASNKQSIALTSGRNMYRFDNKPTGYTDIATPLVNIVTSDEEYDGIFIISDGYENAPAGRVNEVIRALKKIGYKTPISHMNPVASNDSTSVRQMSDDLVPVPVFDPANVVKRQLIDVLKHDVCAGLIGIYDKYISGMIEGGE